MECICRSRRRRLDGDAAIAYATEHLQKVWSDQGDLTGLACPDTGVLWVLDTWRGDDLLGFAPTRLRVVDPELWYAPSGRCVAGLIGMVPTADTVRRGGRSPVGLTVRVRHVQDGRPLIHARNFVTSLRCAA